jgi:hypothetical protein
LRHGWHRWPCHGCSRGQRLRKCWGFSQGWRGWQRRDWSRGCTGWGWSCGRCGGHPAQEKFNAITALNPHIALFASMITDGLPVSRPLVGVLAVLPAVLCNMACLLAQETLSLVTAVLVLRCPSSSTTPEGTFTLVLGTVCCFVSLLSALEANNVRIHRRQRNLGPIVIPCAFVVLDLAPVLVHRCFKVLHCQQHSTCTLLRCQHCLVLHRSCVKYDRNQVFFHNPVSNHIVTIVNAGQLLE